MKLSTTPTASLIACLVVLAASTNAERVTPQLATRGQFLRTNHDDPLDSIYTEDSDDEDEYFADDVEEYEEGSIDDEPQPWSTYPSPMKDGPKFVWTDEASELEDEDDFYGYGPKYMDLEEYLDDEDEEESFDDDEESDSEENIPAGPMFKFPKFVKRGDGPDDDNDFYRYGPKYTDVEEPSYSEDEEDIIDNGEGYGYEYDFDSEDEEDDLDMYDSEEELDMYEEEFLDDEDEMDAYEEEFLDDEDEMDAYEEEFLDEKAGPDTYDEEEEVDMYEEESLDDEDESVYEEELIGDEDESDVNEEEPLDVDVEPEVNEEEPDDEVDLNDKDELHVNRMKMMATAPDSTPTSDKSARFGSILLFSAIGAVGLVLTGATVYAVRKRKREGEPAITRDDEDRSQNELRFSTSTFGDAHDEEIGAHVPASRFSTDYGI